MGAMKTMREKMADEGLKSFIVTFRYPENKSMGDAMQFWAEDALHAVEQAKASEGDDITVLYVETQEQYEANSGTTLDYGRRENV